ncbi:MAG: FAD-dependent oxidoreductase [Proteobacteria bacterium]|nr:FAD-dependent oxidoreductase [Pseudomonadota bacterium]
MTKVRQLPYGELAENGLNIRLAMEEATRCLLCDDAPCSHDCPAGTDPGRFIRAIRFRNFKGAARIIRENNILGATCAEICPQERLCEKACSRCGIDKPINIGRLQAFAMSMEKDMKFQVLEAGKPCGKKVACIGAGPSSLAVAAELAKKGVSVTILDENEKAGGVLRYGITPSRLSDDVIDQDIKAVTDLGVKIVLNKHVSKDDLCALMAEYDAVYVGVGQSASKMIPNMKGADLKGVDTALPFLKKARIANGKIGDLGNVVIIGGGDVAMDCASTARQCGAKSVTVSFVETWETMPASKKEVDYVVDLGVTIIPAFKPLEVIGDDKVSAVKLAAMEGNSSMTLDADTVIFAVGQKVSDDYKDIKADGKLFVGGDAALVRGATVVEAVKSGKEIAEAIAKFLQI